MIKYSLVERHRQAVGTLLSQIILEISSSHISSHDASQYAQALAELEGIISRLDK